MSFLIAAPQLIADAATDLANLGSTIGSANFAAAAATTGVLPAAADEVSTEIASLFSAHAAGYQQLSTQAAAFHQQFVQALTTGAGTYASAEANVVQTLASAVPALGVDLSGGGLSGLGASLGAGISDVGGSLNAALSGGLGGSLSGLAPLGAALNGGFSALAQTGGSLATSLGGGIPGWSAALGASLPGLSGGFSGLGTSLNTALSDGLGGSLSGLGGVWSGLSGSLSTTLSGLGSLGGGLSGLTGVWSGLSGSLSTALSGNLGLSGLLQTGASLMGNLGGAFGLSPYLGANISAGLSGLGAQLSGALSGGLSGMLSSLPTAMINAVAPFQALLTAGSPTAFLTQLQAMETGFNSALINGEFGFNTSLVAQEAALETAMFGGPGALNGVLDDVFNFWNSVLGTGEVGFDTMLGAQFPAVGFGPTSWANPLWYHFVSGLYIPGSFAIGNNGWINGLAGALDQKFLFDLNTIGWWGGTLTGGGPLSTVLNSGIGTLDGWAAPQVYSLDGLVAYESGFNANLLSGELGLEQTLFGSNFALNGAVNAAFNIPNVMLATGEETVGSMLGAFPAPLVGTALTGGATGSFGTIGGLEGILDQTIVAGADLAGML